MNKETLVQELGKIVGADRVSDSEQAVLDAAKDYIGGLRGPPTEHRAGR